MDKSLLRWQANGRYQIHERLRQYAEKRLAQSAADAARIQGRHATYYLDFLHRRGQAILGGQQRQAATEIAADLDNIRTAWYWAAQHHMVEAIGQAIVALAMYWHIKGRYQDAVRMLEDALHYLKDISPAEQPARALLLSEMGWIAIRLGDFDKAEQVFNESDAIYRQLELSPLPGQGTDPLLGLRTLASIQGDYSQAEHLAQQARKIAADQIHLNNLQTANYQLASIAYAQGQYEQAQGYAQAAYTVCRQTGDHWFMAYCLNEMGRAAQALGDEAAARHHFEASYQLRESFHCPRPRVKFALNPRFAFVQPAKHRPGQYWQPALLAIRDQLTTRSHPAASSLLHLIEQPILLEVPSLKGHRGLYLWEDDRATRGTSHA